MKLFDQPSARGLARVTFFLSVFLIWSAARPAAREEMPAPPDVATLWLAPGQSHASTFSDAVELFTSGKVARALPVFAKAAKDSDLGGYGALYYGRAQLASGDPTEALGIAKKLIGTRPVGYLREAANWLAADAAEAKNQWAVAIEHLEAISSNPSLAPEKAFLRLGLAAVNIGDRETAVRALAEAYYDFPLTSEAGEAGMALNRLAKDGATGVPDGLRLELTRAQQLFFARRFADAKASFSAIRSFFTGDDRAVIDLRLAEIDAQTKRYAAARDALAAYISSGATRQDEARYYYIGTLRELGQRDEYIREARAFAASAVDSPFSEETLNDLATYFVLQSDDDEAGSIFAEMYRRFPTGARAERAAWKSGWWFYRSGRFADAAQTFESAAITHRHSDYRPSWLYWSARAHLQLGQRDTAIAGFRQVIADYRNSYYGRLASRALDPVSGAGTSAPVALARRDAGPDLNPGTVPPNAAIIRKLLSVGLYDDAILEVRSAQVEFGTSPLLEATLAYALNRKGELRAGITTMRRAYPQFLAEGGESLPSQLLSIIFPVAHWDLIRRYATLNKLDPFVMAALVAQESTFDAGVRSSANAWGLMQVLPSTGRQYAQILGIRHFSTRRLTDPSANLQIGMAHFSNLLKQFGDLAAALAAYNAGDAKVSRWRAERPGMPRDEFIDDIPYPETQNYVKRILGTAEDYRRLYGS